MNTSPRVLLPLAAFAGLTLTVSACAGSTSAPHHPANAAAPATASTAPATAGPNPSAHHHRHHHAAARPRHPQQAAHHRAACGTSLWAHVYHPDRLKIIQRCKTVHGTVKDLTWEPDGDLHIRLAVRSSLVNSANDTYEHGDLVLEEICQGSVSQADAIAACRGVPHNLTIPAVGDKVTVMGSYVLDQDHGWMEIHPVTGLAVTGHVAAPAPSSPPSSPPAAGGCHPKTPSGNCYEPGQFCPTADAGMSGVAGNGETITCVLESGRYHWHPG